ncbi:hypothetical protein VNO77_22694 [Canavalia gladiata]|uniref:Uncharacterized protein n=1 Tax=Canavalia gladiata TaxID=3824 RepID=A0AAN9L5N8_CANGL
MSTLRDHPSEFQFSNRDQEKTYRRILLRSASPSSALAHSVVEVYLWLGNVWHREGSVSYRRNRRGSQSLNRPQPHLSVKSFGKAIYPYYTSQAANEHGFGSILRDKAR